ncbi:MAG: hypothetical protein LR015_07535 [Verrucomicrobia bacterium]|nr:hypothetical protein [Verrucomicrobiota bacterium]
MGQKRKSQDNHAFEIAFCESILKRRPDYPEVMEMLAGFYTKAGELNKGLELDKKIG